MWYFFFLNFLLIVYSNFFFIYSLHFLEFFVPLSNLYNCCSEQKKIINRLMFFLVQESEKKKYMFACSVQ